MTKLLRAEPALLRGLIGSLVAVALAFVPSLAGNARFDATVGLVLAGLALLPVLTGGLIRGSVFAPDTVTDRVAEAAVQTASELTTGTVGAAGQITGSAVTTATNVVTGVLGATTEVAEEATEAVGKVVTGLGGVVGGVGKVLG